MADNVKIGLIQATHDVDGNEPVAVQIIKKDSSEKIALLFARGIPAKGYKTYALKKISDSCFPEAVSRNKLPELTVGSRKLSNKFFKIELNDNGNIVSLYDKTADREVLIPGAQANVLQAFEDKPMTCDAWNIDCYFSDKKWEINNLESIDVYETGPICASLRLKRRFMDSEIVQYIRIFRDIPRIDFESNIDWKESQILLKASFPVNIHSDFATYDIQFGNITRSTHTNTSWDEAQFEVYAHKWADLSENGYGVSILNDCKYGYDIKGNEMRITLIKSPIDPYPQADKGLHQFTYSLYPHSGDWRQAKTPYMAYRLNSPVYAKLIAENKTGSLPEQFSFVKADKENVIIETIKKAEDSDCFIIRAYECFNSRVRANISFCSELLKVHECSLLEEDISEIEFSGNHFSFDIAPYEIKTFKVKFKARN
jgi:alpha-mannosidase